jgi:hypothetical protein
VLSAQEFARAGDLHRQVIFRPPATQLLLVGSVRLPSIVAEWWHHGETGHTGAGRQEWKNFED